MNNKKLIIERDIKNIFEDTKYIWQELNGMRLFMTGGTGFIGSWMLETLCFAKEKLNLDIEINILTRSSYKFSQKKPHLTNKQYLKLIDGDLMSANIPDGNFTHIVHAATDSSALLNDNNPLFMFDTILNGTRWALELARKKSIQRVLFLSSGAIYGPQPKNVLQIDEDWLGGPDILKAKNAYAEGKRAAEQLCAIYNQMYGVDIVTARIFSILGPGLPFNAHFAAGNFIRDAISGKIIQVNSDGSAYRSYLYISDLITWILIMLVKADAGECYNVGSPNSISIAELAYLTNDILDGSGVNIIGSADNGWNSGRYVPCVDKIMNKLGVKQKVSLKEAIISTSYFDDGG